MKIEILTKTTENVEIQKNEFSDDDSSQESEYESEEEEEENDQETLETLETLAYAARAWLMEASVESRLSNATQSDLSSIALESTGVAERCSALHRASLPQLVAPTPPACTYAADRRTAAG